ncbi:MAG: hypothetical protein P1V51_23420 [Deltaproteobacteria bacterium]|nr:hypothetical protein [Deltaproteobacteria bacterium]
MGALTLAILGLAAGCPEKKKESAGATEPEAAAAAPTPEPAPAPFVAAPFPADDPSLVGKAWEPTAPSDAMAHLNIVQGGVAQVSQKLPGQSFPISKIGRWEAAPPGIRVTITSGQITEIVQLAYGTIEGRPHLRWDGVTHLFVGAEGKKKEMATSPVEVLLTVPGWQPKAPEPAGPTEAELAAAFQAAPPPPEGSPFAPKTVWCHEGEGAYLHLGEGARCLRVDKLIEDDGAAASYPEEKCWWKVEGEELVVRYGPQKTKLLAGKAEHAYAFEKVETRTNLKVDGHVVLQDCDGAGWKSPE